MNSFYGGKQGRTYHIVARYDSVADMIAAFSQGGSYSDVNYGQYVIIDTIKNLNQKSNPENGLLFRREFDYNENIPTKPDREDPSYYDENNNFKDQDYQIDWSNWVQNVGGGAEYVGQIVGPQGDSPEVIPVEWSDIPAAAAVNTINGSASKGKQVIIDPETEQETIQYNDQIRIASVTLRDANGNVTGANIAFDIPKTVFQFTAGSRSPYEYDDSIGQETSNLSGVQLIHQDNQSVEHPFYYKYQIDVPHGIKGDSLENFSIKTAVTRTSQQQQIDEDQFLIDEESDLTEGYQYLVYDVRNFDNTSSGTVTQNQGRFSWNIISAITENYQERSDLTQEFKSTATIGTLYQPELSQTGVNINDDIFLLCIKEGNELPNIIPMNSNNWQVGKIFPQKGINNRQNYSYWKVINISPSTYTGLQVSYTADNQQNFDFKFIDYLYSDDYGKVYCVYTDGNTQQIGSFNTIRKISLSKEGKMTINYLQGNDATFYIKTFDSIELVNNNLKESTHFKYSFYENGQIKELPLKSFNYPIDIVRVGDNIAVLYADPKVREAIASEDAAINLDYYILPYYDSLNNKQYGTEESNSDIVQGVNDTGGTHAGKYGLIYKILSPTTGGYHLLGAATQSMLVYTNGSEDYPTIDENDKELLYGIQNYGSGQYYERAGWLVSIRTTSTVEGSESTKETLYAFDYIHANPKPSVNEEVDVSKFPHTITINNITYPTNWYKLREIDIQDINPEKIYIISESDQSGNRPVNENEGLLSENALWFVLSSPLHTHDNIQGG